MVNVLNLLSKHRKAIMGIAILYVFLHHEWQYLFPKPSIFAQLEYYFIRAGFVGTDVFFFLSGLGIVYSISKNSIAKYYANRVKRIILPFFLVGAIFAIVDNWSFVTYIMNVFCINFYAKSVYSYLWFGCAIITLYIVFPLYYKLLLKCKNGHIFTAVILAIWLVLSICLKDVVRPDFYNFTNRIPVFVVGIYCGWLANNKEIKTGKWIWFVLFGIAAVGTVLLFFTTFKGLYFLVPISNCCIPTLLLGVSLPLLLAGFFEFLQSHKKTHFLYTGFTKFFGFFGMMSFEFYCIEQWLSAKILSPMINAGITVSIVLTLIMFVCSTVASAVIYYTNKYSVKYIELGITKLKNKKAKQNDETPT